MRITVKIEDELLLQAKKLALERNQSLGEIFSEGLRTLLFRPAGNDLKKPTRLATFSGKGVCPTVDLDSNAALLDTMKGR